MKIFLKLFNAIKNPKIIILYLLGSRLFYRLNDETYIKIKYKLSTNKNLNIKHPQTFNEKLQWLKLHDRKEIYTTMVDKYEAKKYVANIIGKEYIIPTIGIFERFEEINFASLPNRFVIKPTHTSGDVYVCKDKELIDYKELKKKVNKWLKRKYYYNHREWPYKNIKPRIIIEKYMVDESGIELKDYKFFCFNGEPKMLFIAVDRPFDTKFNFYDLEFNKLPFKQHYNNFDKKIEKPKGFEKMIELSKNLSKGIPHVRVDFYDINGKVYFGEMTFYHFSGFEKFEPEEWDNKLGELLELPKNEF